jgi:ribosome biogenesis GTPase A
MNVFSSFCLKFFLDLLLTERQRIYILSCGELILSSVQNERLIGFATLPEQVHRKSVKKGFDFTLMVVGESGLGKSTLINSLFLASFYQNRKVPSGPGMFSICVNLKCASHL